MFFALMLTGVGYVSWLLTRFIVWLDAADECGEDAAETPEGKEAGPPESAAARCEESRPAELAAGHAVP